MIILSFDAIWSSSRKKLLGDMGEGMATVKVLMDLCFRGAFGY